LLSQINIFVIQYVQNVIQAYSMHSYFLMCVV